MTTSIASLDVPQSLKLNLPSASNVPISPALKIEYPTATQSSTGFHLPECIEGPVLQDVMVIVQQKQ